MSGGGRESGGGEEAPAVLNLGWEIVVSENYRRIIGRRFRGSPGVRVLPRALDTRRGLDGRCAQYGCAVLTQHLRAKKRRIRRGGILRAGRSSGTIILAESQGAKSRGKSGRRARARWLEEARPRVFANTYRAHAEADRDVEVSTRTSRSPELGCEALAGGDPVSSRLNPCRPADADRLGTNRSE